MTQIESALDGASAGHSASSSLALSDQLAENQCLVESAIHAGRDLRSNRTQRADGWTPERIRAFVHALADCGVVEDAAAAAGMSKKSAYALRNRAAGRSFLLALRGALLLARRRLVDEVVSRAIKGCVETVYREGKIWEQRHRHDNRFALAVLTRLDNQASATQEEGAIARMVAEEFEQFVDIVCDESAEGDSGAVVTFLGNRCELGVSAFDEDHIFNRSGNHVRSGFGLAADAGSKDEEAGDGPDFEGKGDEGNGYIGLVTPPVSGNEPA